MTQLQTLHSGDLEIDFAAYRVLRAGEPVRLTRTEWAILRELVAHRNQVLSHDVLLRRVWGPEYRGESEYVHTYISRLRRKLEQDSANPRYILTEPGIGYVFQDDAPQTATEPSVAESGEESALAVPSVNPLPRAVSQTYTGRARERETLITLLGEDAPLISVYGRAGIGKTALVCRVLSECLLPDAPIHFDGMVFLSHHTTGITTGRILADFSRLLKLDEAASGERATIQQRLVALLERLNRGAYVLLLDNMEAVQDAVTGEPLDRDMMVFLHTILEQSRGLRVVLTGREPLSLPRPLQTRERRIQLIDGLSEAESVSLLRDMDPDGEAGLRDADVDTLRQIARQTRGYPRALEVITGLLLEDPFLTPSDVLDDSLLPSDEINTVLVQQALKRLEPDALRVMQIMSALQRPVTIPTLEQIVAPFVSPESGVRTVLNRLTRNYFLNYDSDTRTLSIHPIDRDYCYSLIPETGEDFSRTTLHKHIARFYQEQSDRVQNHDLQTALSTFEHLVRSGQINPAAQHLLSMDADYRLQQGDPAELKGMYRRILDRIQEASLQRRCRLQLGHACRGSGELWEALDCFEMVYRQAEALDLPQEAAESLSNQAWVRYDLGQFQAAFRDWRRALAIYDRLETVSGLVDVNGGLGWVSYLMGIYDEARIYFREALRLSRILSDQLREALNMGDLGVVLLAQGDVLAAIDLLNQSVNIADYAGSGRETSYKGGYLAEALLLANRLDEADEIIRITLQYRGAPVNDPALLALHGIILTRLDRPDDAVAAFQQAVKRADALLNLTPGLYRVRYARALALAGQVHLTGATLMDASLEYGRAKAICAETGVLDSARRLLAVLAHDNDSLQPLMDLLQA